MSYAHGPPRRFPWPGPFFGLTWTAVVGGLSRVEHDPELHSQKRDLLVTNVGRTGPFPFHGAPTRQVKGTIIQNAIWNNLKKQGCTGTPNGCY